jgi:hypothetical protein
MDLRGQDNFVINWGVTETDVTMTFKDATETTELGTITIERSRVRSFLDGLQEVAMYYEPPAKDMTTREFSKTVFSRDRSRVSF